MNQTEARALLDVEYQRLKVSRAKLTIDEHSGHPNQSTDATPQDSSEIGEQLIQRTESTSELESVDDELAEVEAALTRIDAGTFGVCVDCGKPIPEDRIRAIPSAARCMADQSRLENPRLLRRSEPGS